MNAKWCARVMYFEKRNSTNDLHWASSNSTNSVVVNTNEVHTWQKKRTNYPLNILWKIENMKTTRMKNCQLKKGKYSHFPLNTTLNFHFVIFLFIFILALTHRLSLEQILRWTFNHSKRISASRSNHCVNIESEWKSTVSKTNDNKRHEQWCRWVKRELNSLWWRWRANGGRTHSQWSIVSSFENIETIAIGWLIRRSKCSNGNTKVESEKRNIFTGFYFSFLWVFDYTHLKLSVLINSRISKCWKFYRAI